jgi:hypothetical protein
MITYKTAVWTAEGKEMTSQILKMDERLTELANSPERWKVHTCNSFKFKSPKGETMIFHYLLESSRMVIDDE